MKTLLLLAGLCCPAPAAAQGLPELQQAFNAAAAKAGPAVVSVQVIKEETQTVVEPDYYFGYMVPSEKTYRYHSGGLGSGVIIDPRGYVLTNRHVVADAVRIKVITQDARGVEKEWMASAVGSDPALDLALLKLRAGGPFPALELAGDAPLKVGDFVMAVGYPFGFKQTVTSGIISALKASLTVEGRRYENLIQTDAAINHGNSGGPLLNLKGEVVGLNTAIASPTGVFSGMGFAVPASEIRKVLGDLIAGREIKRGWLGLSLLHVDPVMAARLGLDLPGGAIVNLAVEESPAWRAGIRRGDVILTCDGDPVATNADLFYKTYSKRPGDEVELAYARRGARRTVKVKLAERGAEAAAAPRRQSARTEAGPAVEWEGLRLAFAEGGARVLAVDADSRLAGYLRSGDVIRAVNGVTFDTKAGMEQVFARASLADGAVFDLLRDGQNTYLSVQSR